MLRRQCDPSCWAVLSLVVGTFTCGHPAAEFAPHPPTRGLLAPGRVCSGDGGAIGASGRGDGDAPAHRAGQWVSLWGPGQNRVGWGATKLRAAHSSLNPRRPAPEEEGWRLPWDLAPEGLPQRKDPQGLRRPGPTAPRACPQAAPPGPGRRAVPAAAVSTRQVRVRTRTDRRRGCRMSRGVPTMEQARWDPHQPLP